MIYSSRLTVKCQVTVPRDVRLALGVGPGQKVRFDLRDDGRVELHKDETGAGDGSRSSYRERMAQAAEIFAAGDRYPGMTTDDYMTMLREPVQPFEEDRSS